MCVLPDRPPCTSLSADPSSNTSLVVLNNLLHAIRQVNKQHRGPPTSNWDQGAEDAPRQDLWEGTCGGSMRSCDEAPDEGVVYIFLRWDKWGGPAVNPPWARGWIFRSYRLIVRQKRKWNSEVNHILLFLDRAWKWADNPAPSWVRLGISSTNGYVQAYMYISDYLGNLSKNRQKLSLKSKYPHFKIRCSRGFKATALCQLFAITAAQNVSACITGVADGVNELWLNHDDSQM